MLRNYFFNDFFLSFLKKCTCVWLFLRYIFWWQSLCLHCTVDYLTSIQLLQISSTIKTIKSKSFKYRVLWSNMTLEKECERMYLNMSIILNSRKTLICTKIGISLSYSMSLRLCAKTFKVVAPFLFKHLTDLCWPDCFPWHWVYKCSIQAHLIKSTSDGVQEGRGFEVTSVFLLQCKASVIWLDRVDFFLKSKSNVYI